MIADTFFGSFQCFDDGLEFGMLLVLEYDVKVVTGKLENAGTDANVYLILFGSKHESTEQILNSEGVNDFEKGNKDRFEIESVDLGNIEKIR